MKLPSDLIVALTSEEIADIRRVAHERPGFLPNLYNKTRRDLTRSQIETDRIGLTGEYAVAKLFGLSLDACGLRLKGLQLDGGHDMMLPDGKTVQIKAIEVHTNPNRPYWYSLEGTDPMEFTADVGIMAYVLHRTPGQVKIPGFITRERFITEHVLANLGTGLRAAVATCRFDPIELLLKGQP